jgi:hypothetical protein
VQSSCFSQLHWLLKVRDFRFRRCLEVEKEFPDNVRNCKTMFQELYKPDTPRSSGISLDGLRKITNTSATIADLRAGVLTQDLRARQRYASQSLDRDVAPTFMSPVHFSCLYVRMFFVTTRATNLWVCLYRYDGLDGISLNLVLGIIRVTSYTNRTRSTTAVVRYNSGLISASVFRIERYVKKAKKHK